MLNNGLPDISFLDQQAQLLVRFVDRCHGTQVRKYTGLPYVHHLVAVGRIVMDFTTDQRLLAIALCHDLYEDTECEASHFTKSLIDMGYHKSDAQFIDEKVSELTDEFVKANYPDWNRRKRKKAEAKRLWVVSPEAQTVKYADIIDNSLDLIKNDKGFARRYLDEVQQILKGMDKGESRLYKKAVRTVEDCMKQLS
jgi:(p)ppGpp synthase/HD superfamily hydrolase